MTSKRRTAWVGGIAILTFVSVAGCVTPQPIVRLYPEGKDAIWRAGRGMQVQQKDGFLVAAAFDYQHDDRLAFRVEVENRSAARVNVDHQSISYVACASPKTCSPRYAVVDPERELLAMDLARAQARADQTNSERAGAGLALLGLAGAVAGAASGNAHAGGAALVAGASAASVADDASAAAAQQVFMIDSAQHAWTLTALRRTTLFPGEGAGGDVFLPLAPAAVAVWLRVDIGPATFWFPFRQVVQNPPVAPGASNQLRRKNG